MAAPQPIKVGETQHGAKPFVYDPSKKTLCRFFQINFDDGYAEPEDPLAGRLLSCQFVGDRESVSYHLGHWRHWGQFLLSDQDSIMEELSGVPKHSALSYTWGQDLERYPMYVSTISNHINWHPDKHEGKKFIMDHEPERNGYLWITPSLHSFLQEMRRQKCRSFFWIDAICINQDDIDDKNNQMPRMRAFYAEAEIVYVWLGDGTPIEHDSIRKMPSLTSKLRRNARPDGCDLKEYFAALGLPSPEQATWRACADLLMRDWWSRIWTLQEVVAISAGYDALPEPERVHVRCGPVQVLWTVFAEFADALTRSQLKQWLITGGERVQPGHYHGVDAIAEVRTCRESMKMDRLSVTLDCLLVATRRRQATVPGDMVLGMQALLDHKTVRELALNVSMPTEAVFVRFGKHYIRSEITECLLNHTATKVKLPGLPSWCPNFASPEETISLGTRWLGHYPERETLLAQMPCAGFQEDGRWRHPRRKFMYARWIKNVAVGRGHRHNQHNTRNPRQIALVPHTDCILASGVELDTITHVVPPNSGAEAADFLSLDAARQTLAWDRRCSGLAKWTLGDMPSARAAYDCYARTIVANRVSLFPDEPFEPDTSPAASERADSATSNHNGDEEEEEEADEADEANANGDHNTDKTSTNHDSSGDEDDDDDSYYSADDRSHDDEAEDEDYYSAASDDDDDDNTHKAERVPRPTNPIPAPPETPHELSGSEVFIDRHETHDFAAAYRSFSNFLRQAEAADANAAEAEQALTPAGRAFARSLAGVSRRRSFFATAQGRIGLGPADARVGDALAVLFYCPTPYLLRANRGRSADGAEAAEKKKRGENAETKKKKKKKKGADAEQTCRFVGEAYVRGLMYGEALGMFERGEVGERKWVVE